MAKTTHKLRVRRSVLELQRAYEKGDKKPLENLMRAWKGVKELPWNHPQSFFRLGGFHGEPFRGPGSTDSAYWGGYCNHGNVLFPTWHRVYVLKLEEALQSIPGCEEVMLPYWDETDEYSLQYGIPTVLTDEYFMLDGEQIPNPLRSYTFPVTITDKVVGDDSLYTKPAGYETVRYPLSGLVGTEDARKKTDIHNAQYPDPVKNTQILNDNVLAWLHNETYTGSDGKDTRPANVNQMYRDCLKAPNYTVFSNKTSASQWGEDYNTPVTSLESPHNDIHLAVGGFDVPGQADFSAISGANGDMGENDTAGLDPIFYFHHCNVDRVFWLWQKQNGHTDELDIIPFYPGTNSSDTQGPTPGFPPNTILSPESPLYPFTRKEGGKEVVYTSLDCINIEKQLGITYAPGSLEEPQPREKALLKGHSKKVVHISGISRAPINGSFIIEVYANIDGKKVLVGYDSILSRWNVMRCVNCQTHLEVKSSFSLRSFKSADVDNAKMEVRIRKRTQDGGLLFAEARNAPQEPRIHVR